MIKFLISFITLILVLSSCYACTFVADIKERFFKGQSEQTEIEQEEAPEQQEIQTEPIPVNPSHS